MGRIYILVEAEPSTDYDDNRRIAINEHFYTTREKALQALTDRLNSYKAEAIRNGEGVVIKTYKDRVPGFREQTIFTVDNYDAMECFELYVESYPTDDDNNSFDSTDSVFFDRLQQLANGNF